MKRRLLMYLHQDPKGFKKLIIDTSNKTGIQQKIIEKDYYVTLILRKLSEKRSDVVFKGGTSLSKAFHLINRFSEDIDITFTDKLGHRKRKGLKEQTMKEISNELELKISDFNSINFNHDVNCYEFNYKTLFHGDETILPVVKTETSLCSYAFPVENLNITNYLGNYLIEIGQEYLAKEYQLDPFPMNVQKIERTFIDKTYAICDYYLGNKVIRLSRHLYDLCVLFPEMRFNEELADLYIEVRKHRQKMPVCLSADSNIDISKILLEICDNDYYKDDYLNVTKHIIKDDVQYEDTIKVIKKIAEWLNEKEINTLKD